MVICSFLLLCNILLCDVCIVCHLFLHPAAGHQGRVRYLAIMNIATLNICVPAFYGHKRSFHRNMYKIAGSWAAGMPSSSPGALCLLTTIFALEIPPVLPGPPRVPPSRHPDGEHAGRSGVSSARRGAPLSFTALCPGLHPSRCLGRQMVEFMCLTLCQEFHIGYLMSVTG